MNDQDYIRKALTLPGERFTYLTTESGVSKIDIPQYILDALAAQLVRQVDATGEQYVASTHSYVAVRGRGRCRSHIEYDDNDRTMNTIKAIVDSGVLE